MSHVFKIGDRVRIIYPNSRHFGKEATILGCDEVFFHQTQEWATAYDVDIDGHGKIGLLGYQIAFEADDLEPIQRSGNLIHEILAMKDLPNRDCKIARVGECV